MLKVVAEEAAREELAAGLDQIVREGARRMLASALEAEVEAYLDARQPGYARWLHRPWSSPARRTPARAPPRSSR